MASLKPGNPDRGWNDPPMFSYNSESQSQKTPRRNQLNKRVAHDLSVSKQVNTPGASSTSPSLAGPPTGPPTSGPPTGPPTSGPPTSPPISGPPTGPPISGPPTGPPTSGPPTGPPISGPPTGPPISGPPVGPSTQQPSSQPIASPVDETSDVGDKDNDLQQDCLQKFRKVLTRCTEFIPTKVSEDINKKLTVLSDMWDKNKLSLPVQKKTNELATALSKCDCEKAYEVHVGLMVDHVSEVNLWMVGVKRLIHEARKLTPEPDPPCEEENTTASNDDTKTDNSECSEDTCKGGDKSNENSGSNGGTCKGDDASNNSVNNEETSGQDDKSNDNGENDEVKTNNDDTAVTKEESTGEDAKSKATEN